MLFKAPPENVLEWDIRGIQGMHRWLGRLWTLVGNFIMSDADKLNQHYNENKQQQPSIENLATLSQEEKEILSATHQAIKSFTEAASIEKHAFNVAISELMKLSNTLSAISDAAKSSLSYYLGLRTLTLLLAPMAPHAASEMWLALIQSGPKINSPFAGNSEIEDPLQQNWPEFNQNYLVAEGRTISVMVCYIFTSMI
jgi:leucyl-tRNA synthetase